MSILHGRPSISPFLNFTQRVLQAPWPMPVSCRIHDGEPMTFEGDGTESDEVIEAFVQQVRDRITELMREGLEALDLPIPDHLGMDLEDPP